jgi:hypothetical protein
MDLSRRNVLAGSVLASGAPRWCLVERTEDTQSGD